MKTERKQFSYGVGAIAILAISLGLALIIYGLNFVAFNFLSLLGWIFGPVGIYTVVYSFMTKTQSTYYLVWGTIMVAVAIIGVFYNVVPWYLVIGILVIMLAVIGVIAYMEGKN